MLYAKKGICGLIFLTILICGFTCVASDNSAQYLYVSMEGDDKNIGTSEMPLKTLYGAISKIQKMPKTSDIHVIFREGRYEFDKSAEFDKSVAGNERCHIYYEAAEGEKVEFSGSKVLDTKMFSPVVDEAILKRLSPNAASNVVCTSLKNQGIGKIDKCNFNRSANVVKNEYVSLFLNGKKEMIAQWPNGENNFAVFGDVISKTAFRYFESNPVRWADADQMYVGGYMGRDYAFERATVENIDTEERTITLSSTMMFGINPACAKRWQAFNLLEELDIPGEWFIDLNTMLLYYYPHDNFEESDMLEISYFNQPFLTFSSTDIDFYTTFKGITFTKSRGSVMSGGGNFITMDDCTSAYIDCNAVDLRGINNCFKNSRFIYIGGYAFQVLNYGKMFGKNENVSIVNNYFTKCGLYITTSLPAISASTHNLVIENNMFHNQYGGAAALGWETSEAKVRYNEIYNCERELSDCGIFYCGKNYGDPGNEFAYNLIYDYKSKSKALTDASVMGIYMDDIYSGAYIHHNILVDGGFGGIQIGGGQNNRVENNIILNMKYDPLYTDNRGETWASFDAQTFSGQAASALNKNGFAKKYPWLVDGVRYPLLPMHNTFIQNISDKPMNINARMRELGKVKDNVEISGYEDFVNPDKYDFRVKNGSKLEKLCPNALSEENFSMDRIGVKNEVIQEIDTKYTSFEKLYPKDGAKDIQPAKLMLTWQEAILADEYKITVATDKEMRDIVAEIVSDYAFCDISDYVTSGEKTYYWNVRAVNKSVNHAAEWDNSEGVSSFTTSKYDKIDIEEFELVISKAKKILTAVSPETYYLSAIEDCKAALQETINYTKLTEDKITRLGSQQVLSALEQSISILEKSRIVEESVWGSEQLSAERWNYTEGIELVESKDALVLSSPNSGGNIYLKDFPNDDVLLTFDMKIEFNPDTNGWLGLEMYRKNVTENIWSDSGYLIVIKKDQTEVQKYPGGLIDTVMSDVFMDGNYHKINIGVVKEVGRSRFIYKVDDTPFFEYTDFSPFSENGYFNFRMFEGGTVSIRKHEKDETSETNGFWHDTMYTKIFKANSSACTLTGNWLEGENGIITSDTSAKAIYDFNTGEGTFAVFYHKDKTENGDEKAKYIINADYVSGREGDEKQYAGAIDFSDAYNEWEYLGSYENVMNGMQLQLSVGTPGKSINANSVKIVRIDEAYKALVSLLDKDANVCVMKAGSNTVYCGQKKLESAASPEFSNDVLMLPLRTVAELLGYNVVWDAAERKAIVTADDRDSLAFAESASAYIIDGKMMINVELFENSFAKQVLSDKNGVVAVIDNTVSAELLPDIERLFQ